LALLTNQAPINESQPIHQNQPLPGSALRDANMPLYLLAVYTKGEKIDLTHAEKKAMRGMVVALVEASMQRRFPITARGEN
jgi:hypothetical protein